MKKTVILIIVFTLLLAGAFFAYNYLKDNFVGDTLQTVDSATEEKSNPAPDFEVIDIDENAVKLSDFAGKPVVLNFWASWCPPCKQEMPDFNAAYEKYGDEIQFLMINLTDGGRETLSTAKAFIDNAGYTFPVFYDVSYDASNKYNVGAIPVSYFIDKDGNVVAHAKGAIDANTLQRGIDMIKQKIR